MTVLEHVRFSRPIGPGTQGKRRFSLGELPRKWAFAQAQVGEMLGVGPRGDQSESACRWPIGRPDKWEFAYCGIQTAKGRSYCAGHCRMAYKPPSSRVWDGQRYVAIESMAA